MKCRATGKSRRWDIAQLKCRADRMSRNWNVAHLKSHANGMSRRWDVAQMGYRAKKCRSNDVNHLIRTRDPKNSATIITLSRLILNDTSIVLLIIIKLSQNIYGNSSTLSQTKNLLKWFHTHHEWVTIPSDFSFIYLNERFKFIPRIGLAVRLSSAMITPNR